MRGGEDKIGWGWAGAEQPPAPVGPWACPLRALSFQVLGREGGLEGWDWSQLLGEETQAALPTDHGGLSSLARTIFSSLRGGRGAAGRDKVELVGGERGNGNSIRTYAAVCPSNAFERGVCVCGGQGSVCIGVASSRCLTGLSEAPIKCCSPVLARI